MTKQLLNLKYLLLFLGTSLFFINCGDDDIGIELVDPVEQLRRDKALIEGYLASNGITYEQDESGVYYSIEEVGRGERVNSTGFYNIALEGYYLNGDFTKGDSFDKTDECSPVTFNLGDLIPGFRNGLQNFNVEGKGSIFIPSELAFGQQGFQVIPPNTVLAFDVEVVDQEKFDKAKIRGYLADNNISADSTLSGIFYRIEELGTGEHPTRENTVTVNYRGYFADGTVFDESNTPATFELTGVIQGWQEVLLLLKAGGRGTFLIPSKFGYGEQGRGNIPGNTMLIFDIELIEFR